MGVAKRPNTNLKTGSGVVARILDRARKARKTKRKPLWKNMVLNTHSKEEKFRKKENRRA
jgi:hypothetical protein